MSFMLTGFRAALLGAALVAAHLPQAAAQAAAPRAASAVSVEDFVRRQQFNTYLLSPDGNKLASIAPINGRDNLVVIDLEKRTRANITNFREYDVESTSLRWVTNERVFFRTLSRRDVTGNVTYHGSYAINIDGSNIRNLDNFRGAPAGSRIERVLDSKTGDVAVAANLRRRDAVDLYKINMVNGSVDLMTFDSPANTSGFLMDGKNVPRFAWAATDRRNSRDEELWYRASETDKWERIQVWQEGGEYFEPLAFDGDGSRVLVTSNVGRDKKALYWWDTKTRKLADLVYEHPLIDIAEEADYANNSTPGQASSPAIWLSDPDKPDEPARLVGLRLMADKPVVVWFDERVKNLQQLIDGALPGRYNTFDARAVFGRRTIVRSSHPDELTRNFMFDPVKRQLEDLPPVAPWLQGVQMPQRTYFEYAARDGLKIPSFVTKPRDAAGKKLPLIVHIHGGPYLRDYGPFPTRTESRFFASRGYVVLEPEPRASKGFGRKHFRAGWGTWGQEMQNDITDGVKALVAQGVVDPDRVCLYGGSYGGYATLQGLVREPGMFRCGLATVAVTDLELFQETTWSDIPVETKAMAEWFVERVGDPKKDAARIAENSPLRNADKIKAPVLLMMGSEDIRVPLVHGNKMRDALRKANVPHEYHVYVGEGHGWNKEENRIDSMKRAEAFFAKHLKN
ncbi:MAG: S9 family peptidase [Rubrivivax sp.]|nr:S9 family peptidase [Rubrivivax sp.]